MPSPSNELSALVSDLHARLTHVLEVARADGNARALRKIESLFGGGASAKRGPGRPLGSKNRPKTAVAATPKKRDGRSNSWSRLTPTQRLARVNAIRKAKGLPPRSE